MAEEPETIARAIERRVLEETGLTCAIGIGPNRLLAKLAAPTRKAETIKRAALARFERFPLDRRVRLPGMRVGRLIKT